jgi:hypothetical protein
MGDCHFSYIAKFILFKKKIHWLWNVAVLLRATKRIPHKQTFSKLEQKWADLETCDPPYSTSGS